MYLHLRSRILKSSAASRSCKLAAIPKPLRKSKRHGCLRHRPRCKANRAFGSRKRELARACAAVHAGLGPSHPDSVLVFLRIAFRSPATSWPRRFIRRARSSPTRLLQGVSKKSIPQSPGIGSEPTKTSNGALLAGSEEKLILAAYQLWYSRALCFAKRPIIMGSRDDCR